MCFPGLQNCLHASTPYLIVPATPARLASTAPSHKYQGMNRTLKTALIVSGILLSLILLMVPWRIGAMIRPVVNEAIQVRLPAQTDERVQITELNYQQGIFNSYGQYRITSQIPGSNQLPAFEFHAEIAHGPILIDGDGVNLGAARMKLYSLDQVGTGNNNFELQLLLGFDESLSLEVEVNPVALDDGADQLDLAGATGRLLLRADQSAELDFAIPRLALRAPEAQLDIIIEGLHLHSRSQQIGNPAAPSNIRFSVSGIENRGTTRFSMSNLLAETELLLTSGQNERVDFIQQLRFDELASQWPLQSLDWNFHVQRLPVEVVQDYVIMIRQMQDRIEGGQPIDAALIQSGLLLGIRLLNTDFGVHHTAAVRAYEGEHGSSLDIDYGGIPSLTNITQLDLNELVAALNIQLALHLDLNAVLQSPAADLIDPYVQEGYIILDNGQVLLNSSLQNSELMLNGEVVSLQQFF